MASMTIRNIDEQLKSRLRVQAAHHGRSMEDEARDILRSALSTHEGGRQSLIESIRSRMAPFGGVDLELPARETISSRVDFGE
ncbi:MAG: FitA-like ribbon-helix-helix domain-containing protein [Trinickia sp.]|uniref:FitA-like ribbon-helix-helix domain-containing protein n=1 Tax=Trinickia sp. TaxID=2571163 RepID=UPI003F7F7E49